ncbi:uncharacterized protein LOC132187794 [Corylus avellana]|uniref:uncharacterized protein LOC132187794 n=1 Tax=Corylus avellana TaxID=13451 RepID=UPI00286B9A5D|nr:uncharacterized protein LOC132187794 [Corylus avellana]
MVVPHHPPTPTAGAWSSHAYILDAGGRPSTALLRFSAVPVLQQPFNSGCCFYHKGPFIEFFCKPPYAALEKARLIYGSYRTIDKTIVCCLVLLDQIQNLFLNLYCIYHLGFVVGVLTLLVVLSCNPLSLI